MDVSITEAKNRFTEIIRVVESGEKVIITRHGKPVAQIYLSAPSTSRGPAPCRPSTRIDRVWSRVKIVLAVGPGQVPPLSAGVSLYGAAAA